MGLLNRRAALEMAKDERAGTESAECGCRSVDTRAYLLSDAVRSKG